MLREKLVEPLQQRRVLRYDAQHHRLQVIVVETELVGWHPDLECAPRTPLNANRPSQTAATG
jgi:hypothetical protein